jgi:hypothetical protein
MPKREGGWSDDQYRMPVNGVPREQLGVKMIAAHDAVTKLFPPHTGVMILCFDFGAGGGVSYIANGNRADCINLLEEWIQYQRSLD